MSSSEAPSEAIPISYGKENVSKRRQSKNSLRLKSEQLKESEAIMCLPSLPRLFSWGLKSLVKIPKVATQRVFKYCTGATIAHSKVHILKGNIVAQ
jgi:hypothetical protein